MGVALSLTVDEVVGAGLDHHPGAIELTGWSWGLSSDGHHFGGGQASGKARVEELVVTMPTTAALPQLLGLCASGRRVAGAMLIATSPGDPEHTWLRVTLADVVVTRVRTAASAPEQRSDDEVALAFGAVTVEHIAMGADGVALAPTTFGWNVRTQRPLDGTPTPERPSAGAKGKKGKVKAKGMARLLD